MRLASLNDSVYPQAVHFVHEDDTHALIARIIPTFGGRLCTPNADLDRAPRIDHAGLDRSAERGAVHELAAGKTVPRVRVGIDMDEAGGLRAPRAFKIG